MIRRSWAVYFLAGLVTVALLRDFIANDRPLILRAEGRLYFPILQRMPIVEDREWALWPPIPFKATEVDLREEPYLSPGSVGFDGGRHWLGTDRLGRDTAAGLVVGSRVAVLVGGGSLLIALLLGLPLGAVAGYYGDGHLRVPRYTYLALVLGVGLGLAYGYTGPGLLAQGRGARIVATILCGIAGGCLIYMGGRLLTKVWSGLGHTVALPVDRVVLFLLEMTVSIPRLILLVGLLSFAYRSSIGVVVLVIGLLGWTPVARFLRAELLRVRELPYVASARISGMSEATILLRHAMPNAVGPVVVVAAFLVGGSILAEAMLSFLGLGIPAEQVTWGSLLQQSRSQPTAWWLAVFPGLLLTLTVLACNSLRRSAS